LTFSYFFPKITSADIFPLPQQEGYFLKINSHENTSVADLIFVAWTPTPGCYFIYVFRSCNNTVVKSTLFFYKKFTGEEIFSRKQDYSSTYSFQKHAD
jgi:hypothetical protein